MDKGLWNLVEAACHFPLASRRKKVLNALHRIRHIVHTGTGANWRTTGTEHAWIMSGMVGRHRNNMNEKIERTLQINIPVPFLNLFVQTLPIVSCPIVLSNVPVADVLVNLHGTFGKYAPRHDGLGHRVDAPWHSQGRTQYH